MWSPHCWLPHTCTHPNPLCAILWCSERDHPLPLVSPGLVLPHPLSKYTQCCWGSLWLAETAPRAAPQCHFVAPKAHQKILACLQPAVYMLILLLSWAQWLCSPLTSSWIVYRKLMKQERKCWWDRWLRKLTLVTSKNLNVTGWTSGGHRGLAHPCNQDSLLPIHHLLINTEIREWSGYWKSSVSVCETQSECSKQAACSIQCAGGEVVLTCEYVLCVANYIPTTTTAATLVTRMR